MSAPVPPAYFSSPLTGNETLRAFGETIYGSQCGEDFYLTTSQIAALGGGGGYKYEQLLSSGTTGTVLNVGTNFLCNSPTAGNKTITIPAPTGSKEIITMMDVYGNAGTYSITPVPVSGSILNAGGTGTVIYTNGGSITLYDSELLGIWVGQ